MAHKFLRMVNIYMVLWDGTEFTYEIGKDYKYEMRLETKVSCKEWNAINERVADMKIESSQLKMNCFNCSTKKCAQHRA
jgi:hypothetical protein